MGDRCHLDYPGQSRDDRDGLSPRFFPTVAWPSEAVRVGDESITFIHKRVADPFYGLRAERRSAMRFRVFRVFRG